MRIFRTSYVAFATFFLFQQSVLAKTDLHELVQELVNGDTSVHQKALKKLNDLDASSKKELVEPLLSWMTSYDGEAEPNRGRAVLPLSKIGKPAVAALIEALKKENRYKNGDYDYRYLVVDALGNIGSDADEAIPLMLKSLHDPERNDQLEASILRALPKMGVAGQRAREDYLRNNTIWSTTGTTINKGSSAKH